MRKNFNQRNKGRAILKYIWQYPGTNRKEIASVLGIRQNTVSDVIKQFIDENWVEEDSLKNGSVGRAPLSLNISTAGKLIAAFSYDHENICGALVNTKGEIVHREYMAFTDRQPEFLYDIAAGIFSRLRQQTDSEIVAAAIADRGMVDFFTGEIIRSSTFPGWRNIPLGKELSLRFRLPVLIEDYTRTCAFYEYLSHPEWRQNRDSMIYVDYGYGIGFSLVNHNGIWRGKRFAGELGHVVLDKNGELCRCGARGCLESLAGFEAVEKAIVKLLDSGTESLLSKRKNLKAVDVFEAFLKGDRASRTIIDEVCQHLGKIISFLVSAYDPNYVVIGSGADAAFDALCQGINREIDLRSLPEITASVSLIKSQCNGSEGLSGAASVAFDEIIMNESRNFINYGQ